MVWPDEQEGQQAALVRVYPEAHDLSALAGASPFPVAIQQPRYWVYFDPDWDWNVLTYGNYESFFNDTVREMAASGTATDNPNLAPLRDNGSKLLMWHGFSDQLIMAEGTIDYYDRVVKALGGGYKHTQEFARLFMAPGVAHCGGGTGPQPQNPFQRLGQLGGERCRARDYPRIKRSGRRSDTNQTPLPLSKRCSVDWAR